MRKGLIVGALGLALSGILIGSVAIAQGDPIAQRKDNRKQAGAQMKAIKAVVEAKGPASAVVPAAAKLKELQTAFPKFFPRLVVVLDGFFGVLAPEFSEVDHVVGIADLDVTALIERAPKQFRPGREPSGVRGRRPASRARIADLPHQHWLFQFQRPPADLQQAAAVGAALEVSDHRIGVVALEQVADEFGRGDVRLVTGRNDVREADVLLVRRRHHAHTVPAALRDHRHRPRFERPEPCAPAEAYAGVVLQVEDAEAVGPHDAHVGLARGRNELRLQTLAVFPRFAKTPGEHDRERDAGLAALLDGAHHALCGQRDERHVARLRHELQIGVAGESVDVAVLRIDRMDPAAVAEIDEQLQRLAADAACLLRDAHHGDSPRREEARQIR